MVGHPGCFFAETMLPIAPSTHRPARATFSTRSQMKKRRRGIEAILLFTLRILRSVPSVPRLARRQRDHRAEDCLPLDSRQNVVVVLFIRAGFERPIVSCLCLAQPSITDRDPFRGASRHPESRRWRTRSKTRTHRAPANRTRTRENPP